LRLPPISDDACTWLARQDWKYNVRGLEAFLKRTRVIVCSENGPPQQLEVEDFEKAKSLDQQHEEREVQAPGYARLTIRPARDGDIEAAATDRPSWMLAGEPTEKYWVSRSFSEAIKVEFEAEAKRLGLDVGWQTIEPEAAASGVLALGLLLRFPDSAVARLLRLGVVESKFYDRILRVFKQHEWLIKGGDVRTAKWSIHPDRRRDVATLLAVVRESLSPRLQQTVDEFMAGPGPG
jgi:hypothetical protein